LFAAATEIAAVAARAALLNGGYLEIRSGPQPALGASLTGTRLARLALSATAFGTPAASGGIVTAHANTITSSSALATGIAGYHALLASDDATVVITGTVGTSGADLNLASLAITAGQPVGCSGYFIAQPQA